MKRHRAQNLTPLTSCHVQSFPLKEQKNFRKLMTKQNNYLQNQVNNAKKHNDQQKIDAELQELHCIRVYDFHAIWMQFVRENY